jgi:hypothetical protein
MKVTFNTLVGASLCIAFFATASCKKDASGQSTTPVTTEEATIMSQESAEVEGDDGDVTEMGLSAGADLEVVAKAAAEPGNAGINLGARLDLFADLYFKLGPCATITVSPDTTFPKTVTVNYGTTGCLCRDGKFRRGVVTLTYTAPIRRPGAVLTITVQDYYVNRKHVEGTRIITNLSANGAVKYSVQVKDGKVSWPNGRGFAYASIKTVTQINGSETRTVRDDIYSIEGSAAIKYANGVTVTKETVSPLIKPVACDWIVKGILKVTINNVSLSIDFGNGDCDNKATLTNLKINTTVEIVLP